MKRHIPLNQVFLSIFGIFLLLMACNLFTPGGEDEQNTAEEPTEEISATPTHTAIPGGLGPTVTPQASRCEGLTGEIEIQVLVGPAEAVGLEPFAVGSAPFSTTGDGPVYAITGGGPIEYSDLLEAEWGTYEVTFQMDTIINGECSGESGAETLTLVFESTGEQNVTVDAEGFHGEYPWSGSNTFDLVFPLEEGASVEGEGYIFILHVE